MPAVLVALLVVVPLVELYVLIQVGQVIGALWTVAVLVLVSVLGAWLLRREGARTWRAFREATAGGRLPAREVTDGALVLFGGALLLTPGFVTDVAGLLLVLPPTRAVLRRSTPLSEPLLEVPLLLHAAQYCLMVMELVVAPLLLVRWRDPRWTWGLATAFLGFHLMTFSMITIIFLPHCMALLALLPLERLTTRPTLPAAPVTRIGALTGPPRRGGV